MEDEESLQTTALIRQFPDAIQHLINKFLSHGVMSTSVVVGCIFFAGYQLFGVEEVFVTPCADLVWKGRMKNK